MDRVVVIYVLLEVRVIDEQNIVTLVVHDHIVKNDLLVHFVLREVILLMHELMFAYYVALVMAVIRDLRCVQNVLQEQLIV